MSEFERIISTLTPDMQGILRQLAAGGAGLTARELLGIIARLAAAATDTQRATLWRALMWLANAGRIKLSVLVEAAELMAAGETAGLEAAASAGGAGGAAAGGAAVTVAAVVAFVVALIFAMMASALAYYHISAELGTHVRPAREGIPCTGTGPTDKVFTTWVRRFGSRTSYNAAIREAEHIARTVMSCSGKPCTDDPDGPACTAVAIPISVVPRSRILWTTTTITFRVGCACI